MRFPRCTPVATASVALLLLASPLHAQFVNVALGRAVTGIGTFGVPRVGSPWTNPASAAFATLTDGVRLPNGTNWQEGTVWWDRGGPIDRFAPEVLDTRLEVDFGTTTTLSGFGLSFDNNDVYSVWTRLTLADAWTRWTGVSCSGCGDGLASGTFPQSVVGPRDARYVAIVASEGDGYYSLSEIELYAAVPEPSTVTLLTVGLLALALTARRRPHHA
jgi:hypothetical protein